MIISFIKSIWPYIKPHKSRILGAVALSFVLAALKGAQAYLVKPIFDRGLSDSATTEDAIILASILMGLLIINFPARFFHFYWIRYVVDRATCSVRLEMFKKIQHLPMTFYNRNKQGVVISNLLNDTQTFSQGFKGSIDLIREPLTAVCMLSLACYQDWQLTLVIFAVAPLFIIIFNKSGKKVKENQSIVQEEIGRMTHNIAEGIGAQKISKAFNLQKFIVKRFSKSQESYFSSVMKTTVVEEIAHPMVELVGGIAFSGIIIFAHKRISSGAMTTGDFVSFITAMALFMDPIRKYSQANIKLSQAKAAGERIFGLLKEPEELDAGRFDNFEFKDKIEIDDVTFSYGEGKVINNMSLTIKKGEKVALVGLSGSGKSTLINLLLGLYPIVEGEIRIDGVPLKEIKLKALRNIFGLVSQDIFLFNDTIKTNLEVGNERDPSNIKKALEVSYAHEFVNKLTAGIKTLIGDRGTRLSGGQQQRLTIARAFLIDSPVLLFDEATSALDNESEKVVQKALEKIASTKTVIAVAHRLSTIQEYDKIYVLHEGHLVEKGTHFELLGKKGEYAKLYELSQKI